MLLRTVFSCVLLLLFTLLSAQLELVETGITYTLNFEDSFEGVNEGSYSAAGVASNPLEGQLNSNAWEIIGFSDGDALFGSDQFSGDFTRGNSIGNESNGGLYNFETFPQNHSLGWQSTGSDLSPGSIVLKIKNQCGFSIERMVISYRLYLRNDQNRSQSIALYHSNDNQSYTSTPLIWSSPSTSDTNPVWTDSLFTQNLDLLSIGNGEFFYLKWEIIDNGGSGSRDEWALDAISIQISNNICLNEVFSIADSGSTLISNTGFSLSGVDSYYSSPSNYGQHNPSARMDDYLDQLTSPPLNNVFSLKFWCKALGNSLGSSLLIEGFDGTSWTQIDNISPLPSSGSIYTLLNISGYSQFRMSYLKQSGNLAIDDIIISCGTCQLDENVPFTIDSLNFNNLLCNEAQITWPFINADYYLVLATEKASISTNVSDQHSYYADANFGNGEQVEDSVFVVYNGSANQFTLQHLESGKTYLLRIIPYNGLTCEENYSSNATSSLLTLPDCSLCPYLEWALVNPCNSDCGNDEGKNEMILINSGAYSFSPDSSEFKIRTINTTVSLLNQNIIAAPTLLTYLNNNGTSLFIDGSQLSTIPSNAKVLVCNSAICLSEIPMEILCNDPLVYVLACQSSEWNAFGTLKNQGYLYQGIQLDFNTIESNCVINYQYRPNDLPNQDGTIAFFNSVGGTMNSFQSMNYCNGNLTPLPIDWGSLELSLRNDKIELKWLTYSESQNAGFEIERSQNGVSFTSIGWVESKGQSALAQEYQYTDLAFPWYEVFYRIKQIDLNGNHSYSNIARIQVESEIKLVVIDRIVYISGLNREEYTLSVYSRGGKLMFLRTIVETWDTRFDLKPIPNGVYILKLVSKKGVLTQKVIL